MKRVGILTQYHNSTNYGGALQAYALCKAVEALGYECEQIDIDFKGKYIDLTHESSRFPWVPKPLKSWVYRWYKILKNVYAFYEQRSIEILWQKAFYEFTHSEIPHSERQYDESNINEAVSEYDAFIVGSDQVWNPMWYYEPFFLTFVPREKKKVSYAASISQRELSDKVKKIYSSHLSSFDAISVRERNSVSLLSEITSVGVDYVLDPTLLLEREQWDTITADRLIQSPYAFCYFLGNDNNMRKLAKAYATYNKLVLVNIRNATGVMHSNDLQFGDVILDAPSPNEFLSLIKFSSVVFTDSFHASVFSIVNEIQFFGFSRCEFRLMESRMKDLMDFFGIDERYLGQPESVSLDHMIKMNEIQYPLQYQKLKEEKEKSYDYLRRSISSNE